jgi:hypothetical protein
MAIVPETKLAMAARHVAAGRKVVIRQRALVAKQKIAGRDTLDSETLLYQFERTLAIFESDLRRIEMESAGRAVTAYGRQPPDQGHLQ